MLQKTDMGIPDVKMIEPRLFRDERGFFLESYCKRELDALLGEDINFVQDNHSHSKKNVLRGLHYQIHQTQGKLVRIVSGAIFDVAVDLRKSSNTYGKWVGVYMNAAEHHMLWIPPCFAHGFLVLSETADILYKATDYYSPKDERTLRWDDPELAISWPLDHKPLLSTKDAAGLSLSQCESFP